MYVSSASEVYVFQYSVICVVWCAFEYIFILPRLAGYRHFAQTQNMSSFLCIVFICAVPWINCLLCYLVFSVVFYYFISSNILPFMWCYCCCCFCWSPHSIGLFLLSSSYCKAENNENHTPTLPHTHLFTEFWRNIQIFRLK